MDFQELIKNVDVYKNLSNTYFVNEVKTLSVSSSVVKKPSKQVLLDNESFEVRAKAYAAGRVDRIFYSTIEELEKIKRSYND